MGVDDQLFKEDGTLLTKVDNYLLKVAALLATPLLHEDDETYDRALRALVRASALMLVIGATILLPAAALTTIISVIVPLIAIWLVSYQCRCDGRGSTVEREKKIEALVIFGATASTLSLVPFGAFLPQGQLIVTALPWLWATAALFVFSMFYVIRLGAPPPRTKKAKAPRFAWHH